MASGRSAVTRTRKIRCKSRVLCEEGWASMLGSPIPSGRFVRGRRVSPEPRIFKGNTSLAQVLKHVKPALARTNDVDVAVPIDVDRGHFETGSGGSRREIFLSITLGAIF